MRSWWQRTIVDRLESYLIAVVMLLLTIGFLMVMAVTYARAGGCLAIVVSRDGETLAHAIQTAGYNRPKP